MVGIDPGTVPFDQRVALTAVLAGVLVAAVWAIRRIRRRLPEGMVTRAGTVVLLGGWLVLATGVGSVLVVLWGDLQSLTSLLARPVVATTATRVVLTFGAFAVVYLVTGAVRGVVEEFSASRMAISDHESRVVLRAIQVTLYAFALVGVLGIWKIDVSGLLLGAGVLGIILGLAAQQTLGSLIAGFVLMFSRPFEIGDWVQIGEHEGIVTDITIVNTRIRTFDREHMSIPNDIVESTEVINRTRDDLLRVHAEVSVDYGADLDRAVDAATDAASGVDAVLDDPEPDAALSFGESGIGIDLLFWIDSPSARKRYRTRRQVVQAVKTAFADAGIKIPFPQRELSGRPEGEGLRIANTPFDPDAESDGTCDEEPDGTSDEESDGTPDESPNGANEDDGGA